MLTLALNMYVCGGRGGVGGKVYVCGGRGRVGGKGVHICTSCVCMDDWEMGTAIGHKEGNQVALSILRGEDGVEASQT